MRIEQLAQRALRRLRAFSQMRVGIPVEAQQVADHPDEARREQIARLREHCAEIGAGPLQLPAVSADAKGHLGLVALHAELAEQANQVRVGLAVEDQKAGVHRSGGAIERHVHRVGMPAKAPVTLVQRHPVALALQQPGGAQPGHPGADHGDVAGMPARCGFGREIVGVLGHRQ